MKIFYIFLCCLSAICLNEDENKGFVPDVSINNILRIQNPESSVLFYDKISEMTYNDSIRHFPVLCFTNKSASEYLLVYHYHGDVKNSFGLFEIGYIADCIDISNFVKLPMDYFHTESGISLNTDINNLVNLKGNDYERLQNNGIKYKIDDFEDSAFLKSYNMPKYIMECEFEKNKLRKILFGFSYP